MKNRVSIITIILLVIAIIGLVVALVVTNLNKKENIDVQQEEITTREEDNNENQSSVEETPTYISLDSNIAIELASILQPNTSTIKLAFFHEFQKGYLDQENMTDYRKLQIAYIYGGAKEKVVDNKTISKADMDNAMIKMFGNANYTPQSFDDSGTYYEYDSNTQNFNAVGNGGGGRGSHYIAGVYKIEEYSDRYEVYDKALVVEYSEPLYDTYMVGTAWNVKNADSTSPEYLLERFFEVNGGGSKYSDYDSQEDIVSGITPNNFVQVSDDYYNYTIDYKLLTKYYDKAMEFKHTFMKNEDGSYYWVKSELIK